jgi:hypothetical protein
MHKQKVREKGSKYIYCGNEEHEEHTKVRRIGLGHTNLGWTAELP